MEQKGLILPDLEGIAGVVEHRMGMHHQLPATSRQYARVIARGGSLSRNFHPVVAAMPVPCSPKTLGTQQGQVYQVEGGPDPPGFAPESDRELVGAGGQITGKAQMALVIAEAQLALVA